MSGAESNLALTGADNGAPMRVSAGAGEAGPGPMTDLEQHPHWAVLSRLPMRVSVGVPLPRFKLRDLLALAAGQMILSAWSSTSDVPVVVGAAQVSWAEFEVVEQRMAVRMTRLA